MTSNKELIDLSRSIHLLIQEETAAVAKEIEKINESDKKGKKEIIEFLLISFNQTMQMFDVNEKIKFSDFEELLIHNWSIILKNYLRKFND